DVAAFSFCTDKIITTGGEGGMLVTSRPDIWQRAWSYKDHGRSYLVTVGRQELSQRRNLYERIGTNWRLTQMQAAIGLQQMAKLPGWLQERKRNASKLNSLLAHVPGLRLTLPSQEFGHAYYKYYVHVRPEMLAKGWDRNRIWQTVEECGVPCQLGSDAEIYLDKVFQDRGWQPAVPWPVARQVGKSSLVFPVHPGLQDQHMVRIGETLSAVMKLATTGGHEDA
ncbi:MAG: DegT/DnrJ/EryC1/StrS aminotransferase family protein, partial [Magnetococcales bacterium]|nr:DegT/DnrJ/EryC1/StrS aminotransferase family protein [Magnetococcales bacterium]